MEINSQSGVEILAAIDNQNQASIVVTAAQKCNVATGYWYPQPKATVYADSAPAGSSSASADRGNFLKWHSMEIH